MTLNLLSLLDLTGVDITPQRDLTLEYPLHQTKKHKYLALVEEYMILSSREYYVLSQIKKKKRKTK